MLVTLLGAWVQRQVLPCLYFSEIHSVVASGQKCDLLLVTLHVLGQRNVKGAMGVQMKLQKHSCLLCVHTKEELYNALSSFLSHHTSIPRS